MKLSIKENLSKFHLINEGWMEDLFDNYDEDILYFTGTMLQQAFPDEDISNHPMAEWIANSTKGFLRGESMPLKEPHKTKIINAFQEILKFIKESENPDEDIRKIKSKKPLDALKYVQKDSEELGAKYPESIQRMLDSGEMRIEKDLGDGRLWVEVLKKSFFTNQNEAQGLYGIACQHQGSRPGAKFVGDPYTTFTLLGKDRSGNFYNTLVSIAVNKSDNAFEEIKDSGNKPPGNSNIKGWSDLDSVTVDFILNNLSYANKYYDWSTASIPNQCGGEYGASGTFCWWLDRDSSIIERLISNPKTLTSMTPLIRSSKPEFLEDINVDFEELLREEPDTFFNRLNIYLYKLKGDDKLQNLLENFNFKDYTKSQSALEALFEALPILIENLPFEFFENKIYPHINFGEFLSKMNKSDIKNTLRFIRNKFNKNTNSFLSSFENMFKDFVKGFGGGLKGFGILSTLLNIPRLDMHQNYRKIDGEIIASTEVPVFDESGNREMTLKDVKVPEPDKMLGAKNVLKFFRNNKEWIMSQMSGVDDEKHIQYLKYMLLNLPDEKTRSLHLNDKSSKAESDKDKIISYYDEQRKEGNTDQPGIIEYSKILYPKTEAGVAFGLKDGVKVYKLDIDEKNINKYWQDLFSYYYKSSTGSSYVKFSNALNAMLKTLKISKKTYDVTAKNKNGNLIDSEGRVIRAIRRDENNNKISEVFDENGNVLNFNNNNEMIKYINSRTHTVKKVHFSKDEIKKYIDDFLDVIEKKFGIEGLIYFVENVLYEHEYGGYSKKEIIDILKDKDAINKLMATYQSLLDYDSISNLTKKLIPLIEKGFIDGKRIINFLESEKVKNIIDKESRKSITKEFMFKDLLKKLKNSSINEERIRKYIQNLFENKI
jgi:hypothetical protein